MLDFDKGKVSKKTLSDRIKASTDADEIAALKKSKANIKQFAWKVSGIRKITALQRIAESIDFDAMIIFVRTRNDTVDVSEQLERAGYPAVALNGDMNQAQRERTVDQLKSGKYLFTINY